MVWSNCLKKIIFTWLLFKYLSHYFSYIYLYELKAEVSRGRIQLHIILFHICLTFLYLPSFYFLFFFIFVSLLLLYLSELKAEVSRGRIQLHINEISLRWAATDYSPLQIPSQLPNMNRNVSREPDQQTRVRYLPGLVSKLREGSGYQIGWIFGKLPRGGGQFQSKKLCCIFWELGKLIQKEGIQGSGYVFSTIVLRKIKTRHTEEGMCMHFILSGPHTSLHTCTHIHFKKVAT